jgi:hypothetical protein
MLAAVGVTSEATLSDRRLDLFATVLLAVATVATAWAAYQARVWTGEQSQGYSRANATRADVNRTAALANRQVQIDVATFTQWVDAYAQHHAPLAAFYAARFRNEFKPAFRAWLATKPFTSRAAPKTPFAMPQYRLQAASRAHRLESVADAASQGAKDANQHADNYMLAVVLFASSLFFAGLSTKLGTRTARVTLFALGWAMFLGSAIWIATSPTQVTI